MVFLFTPISPICDAGKLEVRTVNVIFVSNERINVLQLPATTAGVIFLIGQFCDGLVTPVLAHKVDRLSFPHYGKRKTVHFIGSVVVSLAFPFVFTRCPGCEDASYWTLVVYFVPLVCLFHCGWAAVQMCHLSLIPELSSDQKQRDELNIIR